MECKKRDFKSFIVGAVVGGIASFGFGRYAADRRIKLTRNYIDFAFESLSMIRNNSNNFVI